MDAESPIIVVDDNHEDLFILKRLLARAGVKNPIVTFDRGEEASRFLEAAIRTPDTHLIPCAILSDKRMPGFDGFDLLKWVRRQTVLGDTPFFVFTSALEPRDHERADQLGATRLFEKFPPQRVFDDIVRECLMKNCGS